MGTKPLIASPLTMIERADWELVGGSVGFHCPKCRAMIWNSVQFVSDAGTTRLKRDCPRCDWRGRARLAGWNGNT